MIQRIIPCSGQPLPVIGLGTWQTFDVTDDKSYPVLETILKQLHASGGRMIDSSPMYGKAEEVIGNICSHLPVADDFFYATKVWTTGEKEGMHQIEASFRKMKRNTIDLFQIHNITDWKTHLPYLRHLKEKGHIRYIGITHYTDASHAALEQIIIAEKLDFVQFNYSINARHAELRLLDVAANHGVATLINRPFAEGKLFAAVKGKALPEWAIASGMGSWAEYFLKYIISHPAVTCVIPATANPAHASDIMSAGSGLLPNEKMRKKMVDYFDSL
jgi:diketogulonate reductase-like aldo/keto reductase